MRRVLLACTTAVAMVAALLSVTTSPAGAALGLVTDLAVEVEADKALATIDDMVIYTIEVTNVSLAVPSGGTLTSEQTGVGTIQSVHSDPGVNCSQTGETVTCTLPSLDPGESAFVEVTVGSSIGGMTTNTAEVQPEIGILDPDQSDNIDDSTTSFTDGGTRLAAGECIETEGHELCNTSDNDIVVTDFEQTTAGPNPLCSDPECPVVFVDFAKNPDVQGVAEIDLEFGVPDPPCRGIGDTPCATPQISKDGENYEDLPKCESESDTECYFNIYKTKRGVWHVEVRLSTQDPLLPILG